MEKELTNLVDQFTFQKEDTRKLKCKDAFIIADRLNISVGAIGKYCNNNQIKICSCQLGCF